MTIEQHSTLSSRLLSSALSYAKHGFHVFPVWPNRKKPIIKDWPNRATTDEVTIRRWWSRDPDANIGIATGPSGLIAIDVDVKNGAIGMESWRDILQEHGQALGETLTTETPTGGLHMIYRSNGLPVRNSAGKLASGIDVRANGGYIIAPPSIHPNGGAYSWAMGCAPDDIELLPFPASLVKLLTEPTPRRSQSVGDVIPQGQRNETLASIAGSMRRRGMSEKAIYEGLLVVNREQCDPPLEDTEVAAIAHSYAQYPPHDNRGHLGDALSPERAAHAERSAPRAPDPDFRRDITVILTGLDMQHKLPQVMRRQIAGEKVIAWLEKRGGFVQTPDGDLFYFRSKPPRLYDLSTNDWAAFLYALTGANPAGPDYTHLATDCQMAAMSAETRPILRVASWDDQSQTLYVSRFDGTVYVLDGRTIETEANGESVLFDDDPLWQPYKPDFGEHEGTVYWLTTELPNWQGQRERHGLAFRAWLMASFFTELCPTRPILMMLGPKGAGKTMTLRMALRLLFGPYAEVSGVPDKPDGFTAAAAASHVLALDNVDQFTGWLRDKMARLATGATDEYRKLYTGNEVGRIRYRTWLALTARTPDTLKRDDLADRLLILPVEPIEAGKLKAERDFLAQSLAFRGWFWADLLIRLNQMVSAIRAGKLASGSPLRMGDWETLGRVMALTEGRQAEWQAFTEGVGSVQDAFLLEDNAILEGLRLWMRRTENHGREMTTRLLWQELELALFEGRTPPSDWARNTRSFGRRLASVREALRSEYRVEWRTGRSRSLIYQFWPLESGESGES